MGVTVFYGIVCDAIEFKKSCIAHESCNMMNGWGGVIARGKGPKMAHRAVKKFNMQTIGKSQALNHSLAFGPNRREKVFILSEKKILGKTDRK